MPNLLSVCLYPQVVDYLAHRMRKSDSRSHLTLQMLYALLQRVLQVPAWVSALGGKTAEDHQLQSAVVAAAVWRMGYCHREEWELAGRLSDMVLTAVMVSDDTQLTAVPRSFLHPTAPLSFRNRLFTFARVLAEDFRRSSSLSDACKAAVTSYRFRGVHSLVESTFGYYTWAKSTHRSTLGTKPGRAPAGEVAGRVLPGAAVDWALGEGAHAMCSLSLLDDDGGDAVLVDGAATFAWLLVVADVMAALDAAGTPQDQIPCDLVAGEEWMVNAKELEEEPQPRGALWRRLKVPAPGRSDTEEGRHPRPAWSLDADTCGFRYQI
jgi:hypothetical protein